MRASLRSGGSKYPAAAADPMAPINAMPAQGVRLAPNAVRCRTSTVAAAVRGIAIPLQDLGGAAAALTRPRH